jgi:oxygen-independent coproporphyrinogen-3 oxidase
MIHLRRSEGLNLNEVEKRFGEEEAAKIKKESEVYIRNEWIIYNNNIITLTNKGKLMADRIASELFVDQ